MDEPERPRPEPDATLDPATPSSSSGVRSPLETRTLGPYRLVRKLGEGGMGLVWLAEQTAPVRRQVALKLIRSGFYDDSLLQRFQAEQQSLAVMNHPAIAKVFDAGTTPDGQPYFVMEYVAGTSITKFCDAKKLKIRDRLELFIQVCEGVQHAHQKAIIHRDLKPSNVLVAELDGKPVPRIIDFGIAKAIASQNAPDRTLFTQAGAFVGTPGFVSPEQATGVDDVDTRTDVYSLGVILYVLLTGTLPFDPAQWKKRPIDEVLRQLREDDPPSPSTQLDLEKDTRSTAADQRSVAPAELKRLLHGDLDWITMRAVERDRSRRYGTPSELAADLQRYLHNEPVLARPASTGYRLQKYVRRHRIGVAISAAVAALLIAFAITQAMQLRRITRERDRANRITDFMTSMFKVSDPSEARGNSITAREVLDKASKDIDTGLTKDPELQAQLMTVMGNVYDSIGLYPQAQSLLQRSTDIRKRVLGPNHADTLQSLNDLASATGSGGHYAQAEKLDREVIALRTRVLGPEHPDTLKSMADLSNNLRMEGRYADAQAVDQQAATACTRILGAENPQTLGSMSNLATDLERQGHFPEAEKLDRQVVEALRRVKGPDALDTLLRTSNLGWNLLLQGRYGEAEPYLRDSTDRARRTLGSDWPSLKGFTTRLADDLDAQGKYAEAEALHREALAVRRRVYGPDHPSTIISQEALAITLLHDARLTEAEQIFRDTLAAETRVLGPENPGTLSSMTNLAAVLASEHHFDQAEKLYLDANRIQRRVLGPEHPETALSIYNLGVVAAQRGNRSQAFSLLHQAIDHGLGPATLSNLPQDPGLIPLHTDPRFTDLLADANQHMGAGKPR
jgi:serine/threonine protein kinase